MPTPQSPHCLGWWGAMLFCPRCAGSSTPTSHTMSCQFPDSRQARPNAFPALFSFGFNASIAALCTSMRCFRKKIGLSASVLGANLTWHGAHHKKKEWQMKLRNSNKHGSGKKTVGHLKNTPRHNCLKLETSKSSPAFSSVKLGTSMVSHFGSGSADVFGGWWWTVYSTSDFKDLKLMSTWSPSASTREMLPASLGNPAAPAMTSLTSSFVKDCSILTFACPVPSRLTLNRFRGGSCSMASN